MEKFLCRLDDDSERVIEKPHSRTKIVPYQFCAFIYSLLKKSVHGLEFFIRYRISLGMLLFVVYPDDLLIIF